MIELRAEGSESWLDPKSARRLGAELASRLWDRCKGRRGLFVTLTYDRSRYKNALDLYRKQSEEQHVALFLRKVARRLKVSLKGKWFCKLEFQRGGWVHWHIIILDVEKIPHKDATELWGHGHVWLKRLNPKNIRYCAKYLSKGGGLPSWLYFERPRSLKVVRVSPGFWGDGDPPEDPVDDWTEKWLPGEELHGEPPEEGPPPPLRFAGLYEPVGVRLERQKDRFVGRDVATGQYVSGRLDFAMLLVELMRRGCRVVGRCGGWLRITGDLRHLRVAMDAAGGQPAGDSPRRPPPHLHLRGTGNPDASASGVMRRLIDGWFREDAEGAGNA